ncbi:ImmA/IrrE family metallo-endopeptidase [Actinotignum sanguinis]|uniref:ImmA/IrrE family metallo-endopeptidase n=1 Tax=Actinotignum sanguinis TaxID=1445614 RepID=UPI00254EFEA1|nr:ImmA/IrrE family metallo-endopeptidase [Actinotignum sanguinis]MDK8352335.1 ImmA/IrrE family metallo-endopeptidase [Actinotignum sanguinis]
MAHKVYKNIELDVIVERLLEEMGEVDALSGLAALDIEHFAEFRLNADIEYRCLSEDGKTLGMTVLSNGPVEVWDKENKRPLVVAATANTIMLDLESEHCITEGKARFTLAHECGHLFLHRPLEPDSCPDSRTLVAKCGVDFYTRPTNSRRDEQFRERQADRLAAALLMPVSGVRAVVNKYERECAEDPFASAIPIQSHIADVFNVSQEAARIRLECLNLI